MPKHASADTTQVWISVPHYIVANIVVVLRSYASMYSLLPSPTLHGLQVQHLSSYLQQCRKKLTIFLNDLKKLTIFLNHFTPVKGIPNYQHLHIIKNSPDFVFAQRMCTNNADDDITLAHNPEEEFDRQTLPDNLPDILHAAGLSETRLAYCGNELPKYTNVLQGKSYPFAHAGG